MEETENSNKNIKTTTTTTKKKRNTSTAQTGLDSERTKELNETTDSSNQKKKEKKKKKQKLDQDETLSHDPSSEKKLKTTDVSDDKDQNQNDTDQHLNLDALSPIAHPLADRKLCKRVLRTVKKGSKQRFIKRGVKEVVKALRKGEKGLVIMAGDISPMDVLTHIPLLAEENGSGYIFVPTKESLGAASNTKRPTSCVMISTSRGGSQAVQKKFAEKRQALIDQDPTKAAKIDGDIAEYTTAYNAVLSEVLRLNEKIAF